MSDDEREKYPSEEAERFQVRMPPGLRDRIKWYSERNGRSMNAEIVATLEDKYPPPGIDVEILASFLSGFYELDPKERRELLDAINLTMAVSPTPYTIKASSDGVVHFYPYATTRFEADTDE